MDFKTRELFVMAFFELTFPLWPGKILWSASYEAIAYGVNQAACAGRSGTEKGATVFVSNLRFAKLLLFALYTHCRETPGIKIILCDQMEYLEFVDVDGIPCKLRVVPLKMGNLRGTGSGTSVIVGDALEAPEDVIKKCIEPLLCLDGAKLYIIKGTGQTTPEVFVDFKEKLAKSK